MANLLSAVKSVRTQKDEMITDELLTVVQSTDTKKHESPREGIPHQHLREDDVDKTRSPAKSPEEALYILRSRPHVEQLIDTLQRLTSFSVSESGAPFNVNTPGPLQAQIVHSLSSIIIQDFWPVLNEPQRRQLVACLQSVAGFNAVIARLRLLSTQGSTNDGKATQGIVELLDVAQRQFAGPETVAGVWHQLQKDFDNEIKRGMVWKELVTLIGSGKVISTVAQAEDAAKSVAKSSWLANGSEYAEWLGSNIASLVLSVSNGDGAAEAAAAQVFSKAFNIGYSGLLLRGLFRRVLCQDTGVGGYSGSPIAAVVQLLPTHTKRVFTEHLLRWMSGLGSPIDDHETHQRHWEVSALAAFLALMSQDDTIKQHVLTFLADPALSSSVSFSVRRACLAALSGEEDEIQSLLDKTMSTFSNLLFINHSPVIQQESLAQTLLLTAGYVHRQRSMALLMIARSSNHMQGVSNRLDSSNVKARWLGMVVGMAISNLVDKEGSRMSFGIDETETEEARRYIGLVNVEDSIGTLKDFAAILEIPKESAKKAHSSHRPKKVENLATLNGKPLFGPPRPPVQTEVVGEKVTEIVDEDSEEDEDDLKPYAKPDSDPEDSGEDATLVNRNKVRPPVYIRDLMSMLRDDKSHDRFQLGIKHAAALIRRKAKFGAEVKDHAEELALLMCNLLDPFETENFEDLKLSTLIAILLSNIRTIAPLLCKQAFAGDYSIAQRCIILSAIGLGARELVGFKDEDELNPTVGDTDFPSKRLPSHLHSTYTVSAPSTKRLEAASRDMEHKLIKPLALNAADQSTANLNAVKVRTFSSRMEVERTKRKPAPNQLANTFGEVFFFPLVNRYQQETAAYGASSVFASVPVVLVTFLKTLALLLHASGTATLGLPQISGEFWDLLLSLRVQAITDITVLQAVLFGLLTLLEVNEDKKRIAEECPKQLMETQRWADLVFDRTGAGGLVVENESEDETKVRTLSAGVLVKTKEIVEAYQKRLIGYEFD